MTFDQFLFNRFPAYTTNGKRLSKIPTYSSMGHLITVFPIKYDLIIWYGLYEYQLPPTLISPRPAFELENGDVIHNSRAHLDRYMQSFTFEKILDDILYNCDKFWCIRNPLLHNKHKK